MFALSVLQAAGEKGANTTVLLIAIDALTKAYALKVMQIENTGVVSFKFKFTRQGLRTLVEFARLAKRFNTRSQSRAW